MTEKKSDSLESAINRIFALCDGEDDAVAIMATVSGELFNSVKGFDWVGFYRVVEPNLLKIGPYQGGHGCLVIPFDLGVCGAAARNQKIQLVSNVNAFDGHIACSSSTQSELVLPCYDQNGLLLGVLDIDSDKPAFFKECDAGLLDNMLRYLFRNTSF